MYPDTCDIMVKKYKHSCGSDDLFIKIRPIIIHKMDKKDDERYHTLVFQSGCNVILKKQARLA